MTARCNNREIFHVSTSAWLGLVREEGQVISFPVTPSGDVGGTTVNC
ncbi:MAG: hypothetical protein WBA89_04460 [Microcoleus sp.]